MQSKGIANGAQISLFDEKIIDEVIYSVSSHGLSRVDIYCDTSDYLSNNKYDDFSNMNLKQQNIPIYGHQAQSFDFENDFYGRSRSNEIEPQTCGKVYSNRAISYSQESGIITVFGLLEFTVLQRIQVSQ